MIKIHRKLRNVHQRFIVIELVTFFMTIIFSGCEKKTGYITIEGMVWNTVYHITYEGPTNFKDSILPVLNDVSLSLSIFDKQSLVNQLNTSDSVIADENLIAVYDESKRISRISRGVFDPTISPLVTAWGFGICHAATSDTAYVDSILKFVGIDKTYRSNNIIYKKDRRTQFNFSAIAKGFGCDAIGEMFRNNGIQNYMVEIGGELVLSGKSPSGDKWRISIDAPSSSNNTHNESAMIVGLTDMGVATSGNYRNFRLDGDKTLAHTISPLTGYPYLSEILSVTVIAPSCMEADGLATACMASSPEEAQRILKESGAEGLFIFRDSLWMTKDFKNYIIGEVSEPGKTVRN